MFQPKTWKVCETFQVSEYMKVRYMQMPGLEPKTWKVLETFQVSGPNNQPEEKKNKAFIYYASIIF